MRVTFDRFTFDSERRVLLDGTQPVHLGPKAFRLLEILIDNKPRALSKAQLYEQIWPDTFVDEGNLAGLVNEVRAALGDSARNARFVRTVHGFGYAFTAEEASPPAALVIFRGREIPLRPGENILGRDPSADVCVDDVTVSRRHATLMVGETVVLRDLDSKNGTFIDGVRLNEPREIGDGETFVLGDASLVFRRSPSATVTIV